MKLCKTDNKTAEMFDKRADYYDEEDVNKFRQMLAERVLAHVNPEPTDIVLDIGTGTGTLALVLAKCVKRVVAVDVSEGMLRIAKRKARQQGIDNIDFKVAGFLDVEGGAVDIVVSNLALHHLPDSEKIAAVRRMAEILKQCGKLVIGDVMFFFDPLREHEKLELIKHAIKQSFVQQASQLISQFDTEYPTTVEKLNAMLKESGLVVESTEQLLPVAGVISAVKKC